MKTSFGLHVLVLETSSKYFPLFLHKLTKLYHLDVHFSRMSSFFLQNKQELVVLQNNKIKTSNKKDVTYQEHPIMHFNNQFDSTSFLCLNLQCISIYNQMYIPVSKPKFYTTDLIARPSDYFS